MECVDTGGWDQYKWAAEDKLTAGQIYCVTAAWVNAFGPAVLVGWERVSASKDWGFRCGYAPERFKPVYRPKADLIESLKTPAKRERVTVDA